jgi:hypothetical protein
VDYLYPEEQQNSTEPIKSVSENVESVRNRIAKASNLSSPGGIDNDDITSQINPESIFGELQNLRKKYDAVVEYTVNLTAERDLMVKTYMYVCMCVCMNAYICIYRYIENICNAVVEYMIHLIA